MVMMFFFKSCNWQNAKSGLFQAGSVLVLPAKAHCPAILSFFPSKSLCEKEKGELGGWWGERGDTSPDLLWITHRIYRKWHNNPQVLTVQKIFLPPFPLL